MAKLLVDENIPISVMKWLQKEEHDVVRVSEVRIKIPLDILSLVSDS